MWLYVSVINHMMTLVFINVTKNYLVIMRKLTGYNKIIILVITR